jgi:hypothetical protein
MKILSQTKTAGKESASRVLDIDKLYEIQKEIMKKAVGQGLWEQILEGHPMSASTIRLIKGKMRYHNLLPMKMWWDEK